LFAQKKIQSQLVLLLLYTYILVITIILFYYQTIIIYMAGESIMLNDDMVNFMIRNILGHEPPHDFQPAGCGSRLAGLESKISSLREFRGGGPKAKANAGDSKADADAKAGDSKADADAKAGDSKADADAKAGDSKADADAKAEYPTADADAKAEYPIADADADTERGQYVRNYLYMDDDNTMGVLSQYIGQNLNEDLGKFIVQFGLTKRDDINPEAMVELMPDQESDSEAKESASSHIMQTRRKGEAQRKAINACQEVKEIVDYVRMLILGYLRTQDVSIEGVL
jgi:hypothetical protein